MSIYTQVLGGSGHESVNEWAMRKMNTYRQNPARHYNPSLIDQLRSGESRHVCYAFSIHNRTAFKKKKSQTYQISHPHPSSSDSLPPGWQQSVCRRWVRSEGRSRCHPISLAGKTSKEVYVTFQIKVNIVCTYTL